jgi:hypothetical protein
LHVKDYACLGPYIKSWSEGAASWHPSVIGHRLRAAHHSYFWLISLRDAIQELIRSIPVKTLAVAVKESAVHLDRFYAANIVPPVPLHPAPFLDNTQCFTNYEPRHVRNSSLTALIGSGVTDDKNGVG